MDNTITCPYHGKLGVEEFVVGDCKKCDGKLELMSYNLTIGCIGILEIKYYGKEGCNITVYPENYVSRFIQTSVL